MCFFYKFYFAHFDTMPFHVTGIAVPSSKITSIFLFVIPVEPGVNLTDKIAFSVGGTILLFTSASVQLLHPLTTLEIVTGSVPVLTNSKVKGYVFPNSMFPKSIAGWFTVNISQIVLYCSLSYICSTWNCPSFQGSSCLHKPYLP